MAEDSEGAPDYTKLVRILGRDEHGNLVTVRVDPSGRIILLPYGTQKVEGGVAVTGDGQDKLVSLAVDEQGRLIMVPYGLTSLEATGAGQDKLVSLAIDEEGRLIMVPYGLTSLEATGAGQDKLVSLAVDEQGRLIMVPYGLTSLEATGAGQDKLMALAVDDEGRMISVMKGQADVTWELNLWLKFVASEGALCKDHSGWGNDAQGYSGVAEKVIYEDGVIGQAVLFDGTDDYLKGTVLACVTGPGTFTVEFWVYSTLADEGEKRIIFQNSHGGDDRNSICINGGAEPVLAFSYFDGANYYAASGPITLHAWHHVVCIDNLGTLTLWIDGVLQTGTQSAHWGEETESYYIGSDDLGAANMFSGALDEFRVYARSLSPDEIGWRYANTNPVTGKPTRMIAVDNEGRMRATIEGLPYMERILLRDTLATPAAGDYTLATYVVPEGRIWVISNCSAMCMGCNVDVIAITINDGVNDFIMKYDWRVGLVNQVNVEVPLYLKGGDKLVASFENVGEGEWIFLAVNGYELKAT